MTWVHRSPDASGEWETVSAGWGESLSRSLQLDAMGRDVGLDNPYDSGDSGLGSYPNYGDPADLTAGCALDGSVTACGPLFKIVGRDYARYIYLIISGRMGQRMLLDSVNQTYTGGSLPGLSTDNPNGVGYSQTVYAAPDPLSISTVSYNMIWLSIQPVMYIQPQNSGFKTGDPAFSDAQKKILADTFKKINEDDCKNFINETLAKYKVGKDVNSLDKLLNKATFGYYDVSADYTNTDLGVDIESAILLRDAFVNRGASAVTTPDRSHVFLSDIVFERSSSIIPIQSWNRIADTPGYVVHELFHVAGIDKSIVDSQQMTNAIHEHCHLLGSDPITLRH